MIQIDSFKKMEDKNKKPYFLFNVFYMSDAAQDNAFIGLLGFRVMDGVILAPSTLKKGRYYTNVYLGEFTAGSLYDLVKTALFKEDPSYELIDKDYNVSILSDKLSVARFFPNVLKELKESA